jgi:Putative stress-induced transcription regulator
MTTAARPKPRSPVPSQLSARKGPGHRRPGRYDLSVTNQTPSVAAGNSALASEALLRSLVGTVTADGTDLLETREVAVPWLRDAGLLPADATLTGSEHNALLRLRDALRDIAAVRASDGSVATAAERLTRALADGRLVVTVSPAGRAGLASSARASYSNLVAVVAIAVAQAW